MQSLRDHQKKCIDLGSQAKKSTPTTLALNTFPKITIFTLRNDGIMTRSEGSKSQGENGLKKSFVGNNGTTTYCNRERITR